MDKKIKVKHLPIGTKVSYTKFMVKFKDHKRVMWQDFIMPDEPALGFVVGVRTIREGKISHDECGSHFGVTNSIRVYLIAQSLYSKPSHVPIDAVKEL